MDKWIFFSIPGFVIILAIIGVNPESIHNLNEVKILAFTFSTPFIGFIIHQTYRLFFSINNGYENESREVLVFMKNSFKFSDKRKITLKDAFMAWETEIYDNKDFMGFLAHDAKFWHYLHSFRSIILASLLGMAIMIVFHFYVPYNYFMIYHHGFHYIFHGLFLSTLLFVLLLAITIIFFLLERKTYKTLNEQEIGFVTKHQEQFRKSLDDVTKPITNRFK